MTFAYTKELGSVLLALGTLAIAADLLRAPAEFPLLRTYVASLSNSIKTLRLRSRGEEVVRGQVALSCLISGAGLALTPWLFLCVIPTLVLPGLWLRKQVARRVEHIENQLDPFLTALTNALRGNPALGSALASIAPLCPSPMKDELETLLKSFDLGTPLDEGLQDFARRVPSRALSTTVSILCIARRTGGNLTKTLETTAAALREMARLEGVVRTQTASGRTQATALSLLPIPLVGMLYVADNTFLDPLLVTFTGHLVILSSIAMWAVAVVAARWIVAVDI